MHVRTRAVLPLVSLPPLPARAADPPWAAPRLPSVSSSSTLILEPPAEPYGFPAWLRITHYVNLLFLVLLIRSGLPILLDHPPLYGHGQLHPRPGGRPP